MSYRNNIPIMINYIKGQIAELTPTTLTIETNGIGYLLNISINTYTALENQNTVQIYIYEAIREDAFQLFGFITKEERELFLHLISVSGVGANTARMILSSMTVHELKNTIASGNADMLKTVKGIGLKTAQRIIIDLKDKITHGDDQAQDMPTSLAPNSQIETEAVSALVMLGFSQPVSIKAVKKILKNDPVATIEQVIKMALKML